jgi:hypothetical protein
MTERNVSPAEEEQVALRERAEPDGAGSARQAVVCAVDERSRLFQEAADHVLHFSGELNRRLA